MPKFATALDARISRVINYLNSLLIIDMLGVPTQLSSVLWFCLDHGPVLDIDKSKPAKRMLELTTWSLTDLVRFYGDHSRGLIS